MTNYGRFYKKVFKLSFTFLFIISVFACYFYITKRAYDLKSSFNRSHIRHVLKIPQHNLSHTTNHVNRYIYDKIKYMLLWTSSETTPFVYLGSGNDVFKKKKCQWNNCIVTNERNYLGHYTEFDVIAFHGPELIILLTFGDIPVKRKANQKYVYASIEASSNYPLCSNVWNGFFNWTWTYKLNSDALWGYLAVRNATHHVVGPKIDMHWTKMGENDDIGEDLKTKLKTKTKAAAWFVSNCLTQSLREKYVSILKIHLAKFNMDVDTYGKCGKFGCPHEIMPRCFKNMEKKYYFYLAFENAISEDYVTERVVYALQHNTVPIVFGGANYSRFLPDGAYINAYNMKPEHLAAKMYGIIKNQSMYYSFFRWKKHYSFHLRNESPETDDYCRFCAMMNDENLMKTTTTYEHLNRWWTGEHIDKICHPNTRQTIFSDIV